MVHALQRERERDGTLNHNCLSRCLQAKVSLKKGPQKDTVLIDIALSLQQHSPRHGKTVEMNRHTVFKEGILDKNGEY